MQIRLISFAGSTFTVEFSGPKPARIVNLLFQHLPPGDPTASSLTYRLFSDDSPDIVQLYQGGMRLYQGDCEGTAAEQLLHDCCYHLAVQSRSGLILHGAGLAWQGRGLLLPGSTGAGKSTLTAWLVSQGFAYLTDELVFVPWQSDRVQAFTRPINLKKPARLVLADLIDFEKQAAAILSSPHVDLVSPTLLCSTQPRSEGPLDVIVFPHYQAKADFELRQLSRAQAGLVLMETLINARNLPEHGFTEVARLVRRLPTYALTYGNFDQIGTMLNRLLLEGQPVEAGSK